MQIRHLSILTLLLLVSSPDVFAQEGRLQVISFRFANVKNFQPEWIEEMPQRSISPELEIASEILSYRTVAAEDTLTLSILGSMYWNYVSGGSPQTGPVCDDCTAYSFDGHTAALRGWFGAPRPALQEYQPFPVFLSPSFSVGIARHFLSGRPVGNSGIERTRPVRRERFTTLEVGAHLEVLVGHNFDRGLVIQAEHRQYIGLSTKAADYARSRGAWLVGLGYIF